MDVVNYCWLQVRFLGTCLSQAQRRLVLIDHRSWLNYLWFTCNSWLRINIYKLHGIKKKHRSSYNNVLYCLIKRNRTVYFALNGWSLENVLSTVLITIHFNGNWICLVHGQPDSNSVLMRYTLLYKGRYWFSGNR